MRTTLGSHVTFGASIAILVLALSDLTYSIHGNHVIPLPNPVQSPNMKKQSLYNCGGGE